ncbi:unnamed protein product, partial [Discosporangium mesarthrocarpum]
MSTRLATFAAGAPALALDASRRLWNVALPLGSTPAGRACAFPFIKQALEEIGKIGVTGGATFRAQMYVLLCEGYSDRGEWRKGLEAAAEASTRLPSEHQKCLWRWRDMFQKHGSQIETKVTDEVETPKIRNAKRSKTGESSREQLAACAKALDAASDHFERVDCLIEMGEWMVAGQMEGQGQGQGIEGMEDCLRAALDLLYDAEEK